MSPDDAAEDFARIYNKHSIEQGREFATTIYEQKVYVGKKFGIKRNYYYYSYLSPKRGRAKGVTPPRLWFAKWRKRRRVADAHTHGRYREGFEGEDELFTTQDLRGARDSGQPIYLATPMGKLIKYDPRTREKEELLDDLPYDQKHPWKKK